MDSAIASWFMDGGPAELLQGGRLADVVLVATGLEFLALTAWRGLGRSGLSVLAVVRMLLPGVLLTFALRVALVGGATVWVAALLALAGAAHVADLVSRWGTARQKPG